MSNYRVKLFGIILSTLCIVLFTATGFAAGVKPLVVDVKAQPGETKEFGLKLTPGQAKEKVKFSLYQPIQLISGGLTYQKAEKGSFPAAEWIELSKNQVTVYPGEKTTVSGVVEVPFNAGGSHTVVVMVAPQKPSQRKGGVKVMVRYAVRINIRVDRPGVRARANLAEFGLTANEEDKPRIKALVANPSQLDYLVAGEATIRNSDRQLVERVTLKSPAGNKSKVDKTRMYPGSKVKYLGDITTHLQPGKYNLRVFFRYAEHGQIIEEKTIRVKKDQFDFPSLAKLGAFTVEPKKLKLQLNPGEYQSKVLNLNSQIGKDTQVMIGVSEIKEDYSYSLVDWIKLRGQTNFKLRARKKSQVILTAAVPREISKGSYHGNIWLKTFNPNTKELLTKREVPISVVIGEKHDYKVKVKSLYVKQVKEGQLLSLNLFNQGKVMIQPRAEVIIKNNKGKFVKRVQLTGAVDQQVLPQTSQRLQGVKELKPGNYTAEITIKQAGETVKTVEKEFKVKK